MKDSILISFEFKDGKWIASGLMNETSTKEVADDRRAAIEKVLDALLGK